MHMTTQTLTLTDFLLARIAEDEERHGDDCSLEGHYASCAYVVSDWQCTCDMPRRVPAECEAKRGIVGLHVTIRAAYPGTTIESDPCCAECSAGGEYPGDFPCRTLRLLALPYADHPDYRDEWRP